jgi:hypothetical protein
MAHIRLADSSDLQSLAELRTALWPESTQDDHARELAAILDGSARRVLPAFSKPASVPAPMAATNRAQLATSKAGTSQNNFAARESGPLQSKANSRSASMNLLASRSPLAVSSTERPCNSNHFSPGLAFFS